MVIRINLLRRILRQRCEKCGQRLYKYVEWTVRQGGGEDWTCPDSGPCLLRQNEKQRKDNERRTNEVAEELAERVRQEDGR